jgi:beta-lactam-binding protein with PASTA domain
MDFLRFLFSKRFLKHFAGVVILGVILVWIILFALRIYTRHAEYISVPDFKGMTISEIAENRDFSDFEFGVVDSVFDQTRPKWTVLNQDPYPASHVKRGRMIYLTIVSFVPEKTTMPDLRNLSLRQAIGTLESIGLKPGRILYIPAFDEDAVQQQRFNGEVIAPGTRLDKGSRIDLTVGMGAKGQYVPPVVENDTAGEVDSM